MDNLYFRIRKERLEHKGERYFCYNPMRRQVLQICITSKVTSGRHGRSHAMGIYFILADSFLANYYAPTLTYLEESTKEEFQKKRKEAYKLLNSDF